MTAENKVNEMVEGLVDTISYDYPPKNLDRLKKLKAVESSELCKMARVGTLYLKMLKHEDKYGCSWMFTEGPVKRTWGQLQDAIKAIEAIKAETKKGEKNV